jgi:hypothetical protein
MGIEVVQVRGYHVVLHMNCFPQAGDKLRIAGEVPVGVVIDLLFIEGESLKPQGIGAGRKRSRSSISARGGRDNKIHRTRCTGLEGTIKWRQREHMLESVLVVVVPPERKVGDSDIL